MNEMEKLKKQDVSSGYGKKQGITAVCMKGVSWENGYVNQVSQARKWTHGKNSSKGIGSLMFNAQNIWEQPHDKQR